MLGLRIRRPHQESPTPPSPTLISQSWTQRITGSNCFAEFKGQNWEKGDGPRELMSSLLERDYWCWLMEKEKEILPVKKKKTGRRFPAGSLKPLDIKLTLIWYSVKRQSRRTQIGKGLIRGLVKPPEGILPLSLAPPNPLEEAQALQPGFRHSEA